jgi:hypothetical protein
MQQDQVICQTDPDLWFSSSKKERQDAIILCGTCPIQEECKILGENESWGVWGGVDRTGEESPIKYCRSGKHEKTGTGTCLACRRESQAAYHKAHAKEINAKKPKRIKPRKHVLGGYCVNGHLLQEGSVSIRSSDQAILCKKCISGAKRQPNKAFHRKGDFN